MNINTPSQGKIYANIAFVLADVLESCMLDANQNLRKENQEFKHEAKREFNTAIASIRKIKSHINKCMLCGEHSETMHIDHDHESGKYRGVLCSKCNNGLGFFNDSIEMLKKAIEYLYKE